MADFSDLPSEIVVEIMRRANLVERMKFSVTSHFFKQLADTHALTLIEPFSVEELKLLSDKGNFFDLKNELNLSQQEASYFKDPKESFSDWYDRLENSSCYITHTMQRKIESAEQLGGGKVVQTRAEAEQGSLSMRTRHRPIYVKVNLLSVILKQRLSNKDFKNIAPHVAEINDRAVSFNESDNKFEESSPTLGNK